MSEKDKLINSFEVTVLKSGEYLRDKNINKVNFLKIDTEGYEFEVLQGLGNEISKIETIMLEHHYDNMIQKNYTYGDIFNLLKKNNFKMVYKAKMPFRRTFEYIFFNND